MLRWSRLSLLTVALGALLAFGCGDSGSGNRDGGGTDPTGDGGTDPTGDGGTGTADARPGTGECTAGNAECNDCIDNEDEPDGLIDGDDPHCQGPLDDDESSFQTGISGDNVDPKKQDCFFDGNSGGDQIDTCCLLSAETCEAADGAFGPSPPNDCTFEETTCAEAAPAGCDCFGCCTVCNPETGDCADVMTNPGVSPDCDPADIGTDTAAECLSCTKFETCNGGECNEDPTDCVLCPGETEEDLPDSCNMQNECPNDGVECATTDDCGANAYCSVGCCVSVVD